MGVVAFGNDAEPNPSQVMQLDQPMAPDAAINPITLAISEEYGGVNPRIVMRMATEADGWMVLNRWIGERGSSRCRLRQKISCLHPLRSGCTRLKYA